ncbi:hypothetical protein HYFRA_00009170 [Hymenoscyphus fraxineus]|uniref:Uncharacterized protein n=1 Tax=Hymenoscyphus fraxineus TaxID=746836 RepID=A0A9N9KV61_9HELO|nr:hypothetical protein HYFRA_00009170 [Hymenoscyphus fraxineus]
MRFFSLLVGLLGHFISAIANPLPSNPSPVPFSPLETTSHHASSTDLETSDNPRSMALTESSQIAKRNKDKLNCCSDIPSQPWKYTSRLDIEQGINYLWDYWPKGLATICIQSNTCQRLTCYGSGEIRLCNDNDYQICPNLSYLASYAEDIVRACNYPDNQYVCGQYFDTDGYNVIVKQANDKVGGHC